MNQIVYRELREIARRQDTTTYAKVAPLAGLDMENPSDRNEIANILDEINQNEHTRGRPMLSAVVLLAQQNIPGEGFFTCAKELGVYTGTDNLKFWLAGLRRVHDYWSNH